MRDLGPTMLGHKPSPLSLPCAWLFLFWTLSTKPPLKKELLLLKKDEMNIRKDTGGLDQEHNEYMEDLKSGGHSN